MVLQNGSNPVTDGATPRILILDRNRRNLILLTQFLEQHGYQVVSTISLEEVPHILSQVSRINLTLIDVSGFDDRVWTLCQQLREQEIPFLIISPRQRLDIQQASIVHGALGLLGKPLVMREFSQLIRELLKGLA